MAISNESSIPLIETLFQDWREVIGPDFEGYRNHVYRMVHFCFALRECTPEEREKIMIAGEFHDIGIWTDDTMDYISPSIGAAMEYLKRRGQEKWSDEISMMISEHHKLTTYRDPKFVLVEVFRKGDLIDFSLGIFKCGVSRRRVKEVRALFSNQGFHWMLVKRVSKWILFHPLNPVPMMKK